MKAIFVSTKGTIEGTLETMNLDHLTITGYVKKRFSKNLNCMIPREELIGKPKFKEFLGPFWDGDRIRYEDPETYNQLSQ